MRPSNFASRLVLIAALAGCGDDEAEQQADAESGAEVSDDTAEIEDSTAEESLQDVAEVRDPPESIRECFAEFYDESLPTPDYDQFDLPVGSHCVGTNQQDIGEFEKIVFMGDSITSGTLPTLMEDWFRILLENEYEAEFGRELEVVDVSKYGARMDDLMKEPHKQVLTAFPEVEPKPVLVVMTMGGNDIFAWAEDSADGMSEAEIYAQVDEAVADFSEAMHYFSDNPDKFPGGVWVIFANAYEFTDGTGDLAACALATAIGLPAAWPEGRGPVVHFNEQLARVAKETGVDMLFLLETFCGHGFHNENEASQCYRGPETPRWIDDTCIHPNPAGHRAIADMVKMIVAE